LTLGHCRRGTLHCEFDVVRDGFEQAKTTARLRCVFHSSSPTTQATIGSVHALAVIARMNNPAVTMTG